MYMFHYKKSFNHNHYVDPYLVDSAIRCLELIYLFLIDSALKMSQDPFANINHDTYAKCFDVLAENPSMAHMRKDILEKKREFLVRASECTPRYTQARMRTYTTHTVTHSR